MILFLDPAAIARLIIVTFPHSGTFRSNSLMTSYFEYSKHLSRIPLASCSYFFAYSMYNSCCVTESECSANLFSRRTATKAELRPLRRVSSEYVLIPTLLVIIHVILWSGYVNFRFQTIMFGTLDCVMKRELGCVLLGRSLNL